MEKFVVVINSQFGSMGRPIAKKMAEQLNVDFYDRDIIELAAKKIDMPLKEASDLEESAAKGAFWQMCFPLGFGSDDKKLKLFEEQRQIIINLGDAKSSIIVGRCSDYILRQHKNLIRIFIYAPEEARVLNCVNYLHMEEKEARKMIKDVDKARDAYQLQYANYKQGDFHYNDIIIDSSFLGVCETAKFLSNLVIAKFG